MFKVTKAAAQQIRKDAREGDVEELALRVAATRESDRSISYKMGFDEINEGDTLLNSLGVDILIRGPDKELLNGTILDYVELETESFHFIFLNPNDPHHQPPTE